VLSSTGRRDAILWDLPQIVAGTPVLQLCLQPRGVNPNRGLGVRDAEMFGAAEPQPTASAGRNINTRSLHEPHGS